MCLVKQNSSSWLVANWSSCHGKIAQASCLTSGGYDGGIRAWTLVKFKLSALLSGPHFRCCRETVAVWSSLCSRLRSWCRFISPQSRSTVAAVSVHTLLTYYHTECLINIVITWISSRFSAQKWRGTINSLFYCTCSFNFLFSTKLHV